MLLLLNRLLYATACCAGLLSSKSGAVQRSAARALNNLAWDIDNRAVIAAAGGIPSLVRSVTKQTTALCVPPAVIAVCLHYLAAAAW
jgi:hypothetical protein